MTYSNKEANNISLMINCLMFIQRINRETMDWMVTVDENRS
jgi:hypothetical protein